MSKIEILKELHAFKEIHSSYKVQLDLMKDQLSSNQQSEPRFQEIPFIKMSHELSHYEQRKRGIKIKKNPEEKAGYKNKGQKNFYASVNKNVTDLPWFPKFFGVAFIFGFPPLTVIPLGKYLIRNLHMVEAEYIIVILCILYLFLFPGVLWILTSIAIRIVGRIERRFEIEKQLLEFHNENKEIKKRNHETRKKYEQENKVYKKSKKELERQQTQINKLNYDFKRKLEETASSIPQYYRQNIKAIDKFIEYFTNGRVDTLKECINLYEHEFQIIKKFSELHDRVEDLTYSHDEMLSSQKKFNSLQHRKLEELEASNHSLKDSLDYNNEKLRNELRELKH